MLTLKFGDSIKFHGKYDYFLPYPNSHGRDGERGVVPWFFNTLKKFNRKILIL